MGEYIRLLRKAVFPWGCIVVVLRLLFDVLVHGNSSGWTLWWSLYRSIVFGILLSVVLAYAYWHEKRKS